MEDANHALSTFSRHGFRLDGLEWPSVAHYVEGMKFEDGALRERIRDTDHPKAAQRLARRQRRRVRWDWDDVREVYMTRGVYTKCRAHPEAADALLDTAERNIIETSQYDYYWGCGRDTRGLNTYGKVLMNVRARLLEEASASTE
ncbi:MAG: NADAR family protein [Gammaproteobacteria bacterium]|nr:NADAR family protein [Gammaproteobacteria bacterium]MYE83473.1 NADAR family protein [Gammaproteobacteria bacterium]